MDDASSSSAVQATGLNPADWRKIRSAPKDAHVLLYGVQQPFEGVCARGPLIFTGYWDHIDGAWCGTGSTWLGPFYTPTHWMPLPSAPSPATPEDPARLQALSTGAHRRTTHV